MKSKVNENFTNNLTKIIFSSILFILLICSQPAIAAPNYIFFSINGDSTLSTMTQGDEFFWGSNCDLGATINWEIWYDINSNSQIDPLIDFLLSSESMTDGNLLTDPVPIADGWVITEPFNLSSEPGGYIFKATDIDTDSTVQKIATMVAMSSPPNQFTGQITLPGIVAPNSMLANHFVIAESDTGDEGVFLGLTDNNGNYSLNVGALGTGVLFYIEPTNVDGFVTPYATTATASGVVPNNNFTYGTAIDSVWGFVKDETGAVIPFESDVSATSGNLDKDATTKSGRYVIYFSSSEKGDWFLETSSRNSPVYLSGSGLNFSHDTLTSFSQDIILTKTDAIIYARITENGVPAVNNYRVDAYSQALGIWGESVSGTGSDNIAEIAVSTLDNLSWIVTLNTYSDDYPLPAGLILVTSGIANLKPGDTVSFNLTTGKLISGTITQDPGDSPIDWSNVEMFADNFIGSQFHQTVGLGGVYSLYTTTGNLFMTANADGYIVNPGWRFMTITGDTSGVGLGFEINNTHCRLSGTISNVTLPLNSSSHQMVARTGADNLSGYYVSVDIDSVTGTYSMQLPDGNWTIAPPHTLPDVIAPATQVLIIGESPDSVKTVDFVYTSVVSVENIDESSLPGSYFLSQNYPNPFNPSTNFSFSLPRSSQVNITIFNTLGQKVVQLVNNEYSAGTYKVTWDGRIASGERASSGIYFYKLKTDGFVNTKKMILVK